jgi:lipopolysaccharide export system permease protein
MMIGFTLGRYFALRFLRTVLGVFITVFALVYTLDFVELLRRAGDTEGASTSLMAQLSLYRTPAVAEGVLPFAILFGSMAESRPGSSSSPASWWRWPSGLSRWGSTIPSRRR